MNSFPFSIFARLCKSSSDEDAAVLADWCEEAGLVRWKLVINDAIRKITRRDKIQAIYSALDAMNNIIHPMPIHCRCPAPGESEVFYSKNKYYNQWICHQVYGWSPPEEIDK